MLDEACFEKASSFKLIFYLIAYKLRLKAAVESSRNSFMLISLPCVQSNRGTFEQFSAPSPELGVEDRVLNPVSWA